MGTRRKLQTPKPQPIEITNPFEFNEAGHITDGRALEADTIAGDQFFNYFLGFNL